LWWGHNQQLELGFHPHLCGWKLEEVAYFWIYNESLKEVGLTTSLLCWSIVPPFLGDCVMGIWLPSCFTLVQMVWWHFMAWR
jgi:hypothetical protein